METGHHGLNGQRALQPAALELAFELELVTILPQVVEGTHVMERLRMKKIVTLTPVLVYHISFLLDRLTGCGYWFLQALVPLARSSPQCASSCSWSCRCPAYLCN